MSKVPGVPAGEVHVPKGEKPELVEQMDEALDAIGKIDFGAIDLNSLSLGGCMEAHRRHDYEFVFPRLGGKVYHWHRRENGNAYAVRGRIHKDAIRV